MISNSKTFLAIFMTVLPHKSTQLSLNIDYQLNKGAFQLLTELIPDSSFLDQILDHGCWCAKLNQRNSQEIGLGGNTATDDLDDICKSWAHARRCAKLNLDATCKLILNNNESNAFYQVQTSDLTDAVCSESNNMCLSEACEIDVRFVQSIVDWRLNNPNDFVAVAGVCDLNMNLSGGSSGIVSCNK